MDETNREFRKVATAVRLQSKPILVLANKQDVPGALSPVHVAVKLGLDEEHVTGPCKVFRTSLKVADGAEQDPEVNKALEWLVKVRVLACVYRLHCPCMP